MRIAAATTGSRVRTTPLRCIALARTSGFILGSVGGRACGGIWYALRSRDFIAEGILQALCTHLRPNKIHETLLSNHGPNQSNKHQLNRLIRTTLAIIGKNCQSSFSYEISYNKKGGFIHFTNPDSFNFRLPTKCSMRDPEEQTN
ncbi:hypothetical protein IPU70_13265 [Achromobacter sp. SD115]|uniref:hypothetical protein n=1 Tax=Achromobacter sp. SD115 TaxID=2782011 RepID=UPI001A9670AB|nr:hypothetical protein [Achromobacter sp. SD115]MBO1014526.1 hypothetical protein [Achromobacter sp. SD115]